MVNLYEKNDIKMGIRKIGCDDVDLNIHSEAGWGGDPLSTSSRAATIPFLLFLYIPLQPPGHSVLRECFSDNHVTTFGLTQGRRRLQRNIQIDTKKEVSTAVIPTTHRPFFDLTIIQTPLFAVRFPHKLKPERSLFGTTGAGKK
jgi:hypothetical protein